MTTIRVLASISLIVACFGNRLHAAPNDSVTMELEQAVDSAISFAPGLRASRAAVSRERSMVRQVTRKPNPVFGYMASEVGNEGKAGQQGAFLYQDFRTAGKLDLQGEIQKYAAEIACRQYEIMELQVILRTEFVYLDVAYLQERAALLDRLQASLDTTAERVAALFDSGEVGKSPLLQARLEAGRNHVRVQQNLTQLTAARNSISTLLGWAPTEFIANPAVLDIEFEPPQREQAWQTVLSLSPELALARAEHQRVLWQVQREQVEPIPDVQTQWSVQQDSATNSTVAGIQIGFELPVHDRNRGAISAARADMRRTHHGISAVAQQLERRLAVTLGDYQRAWLQLLAMRGELQQLATENLQATEESFAAGEVSYIDLLNAQRSFIALSQDILAQKLAVAQAKAKIDAMLIDLP